MNYIKKLEGDKARLESAIAAVAGEISAFEKFLAGPKFTGVDLDGSRKDWISTGDLRRWLSDLRSELNSGE